MTSVKLPLLKVTKCTTFLHQIRPTNITVLVGFTVTRKTNTLMHVDK